MTSALCSEFVDRADHRLGSTVSIAPLLAEHDTNRSFRFIASNRSDFDMTCSDSGIACSKAYQDSCFRDYLSVINPPIDYNRFENKEKNTPEKSPTIAHPAIALINEWLADESGYDEETWPVLKKALDEDRLSYRRLFDD